MGRHLDATNQSYLLSAVYAYEDRAFHTFTKAQKHGIKCIYDLPIAYWEHANALLMEEPNRLPEWAETLEGVHCWIFREAPK